MRISHAFLFLFFSLQASASDTSSSSTSTSNHSVIEQQGWTLVFEDDFNGHKLDTEKWAYEIACWGGGNQEKECYVDDEENVYIEDGKLTLKATYVPGGYTGKKKGCTNNNQDSCTWTQPCKSGAVNTQHYFAGSWKYGRIDVNARLPGGEFLWPAIWMLSLDDNYGGWAASGEIDIMEARGQNTTLVAETLHFGAPWPNNAEKGSGFITFDDKNGEPIDFTAGFHTFSVVWTEEYIKWEVDGVSKYNQTLDRWFNSTSNNPYTAKGQPFDKPFYLILNLAVAGGFFPPSWGTFNASIASQTWTNPMQIDWVRVYSSPVKEPVTHGKEPLDHPQTAGSWFKQYWWVLLLGLTGAACCTAVAAGVASKRWQQNREEYLTLLDD